MYARQGIGTENEERERMNILVCDDDREIVEAIEIYLSQEGYHILKAYDGMQALKVMEQEEVHLLIIDVMMPKLDGIRATLKIREKSSIPIIILSAKSEDVDKILGLNIGADDYVTKPFPVSVFQKKVAALLARIRKQSGGDFYNDGNLFINFTEMTATLGGETISFTPMEYRLLKVLTKNPQIVLTRQVLLEKLWDIDGNFVDEHALTSTISRVRSKIENPGHAYIKTVYGMGYMWIGGGNK